MNIACTKSITFANSLTTKFLAGEEGKPAANSMGVLERNL